MAKKVNLSKINNILEKYINKKGILIQALQEIQRANGYLSERILEKIANNLDVPLSQVYGVVTFYTQFRFHPQGENTIKMCHGTACHVNGAEEMTKVLEEELGIVDGEMTKDGKFSLDNVACLGCCSLAPVLMVNEKAYGRLNNKIVRGILKKYGKSKKN
ncbi:MAG: NADH-quinone oxidoreductase subunit NuoE [Actinomycetia bacterium]|nr:NADH-quinone oxidoreductase subunit NuoE [Actinomycetes bacterium]